MSWWEFVTRLGVALLVGIVIGLDRELRKKAAGLRTYMLVSFGAAVFVLVPIQLGIVQESVETLSRVIQGIITGIGFVGGGVILQRPRDNSEKSPVQGLTSATAIWTTAALGIAAGCGLWQLSLIGVGISFFILRVLKRVEQIM